MEDNNDLAETTPISPNTSVEGRGLPEIDLIETILFDLLIEDQELNIPTNTN